MVLAIDITFPLIALDVGVIHMGILIVVWVEVLAEGTSRLEDIAALIFRRQLFLQDVRNGFQVLINFSLRVKFLVNLHQVIQPVFSIEAAAGEPSDPDV